MDLGDRRSPYNSKLAKIIRSHIQEHRVPKIGMILF
jgi:hypothetical protein